MYVFIAWWLYMEFLNLSAISIWTQDKTNRHKIHLGPESVYFHFVILQAEIKKEEDKISFQ